MTENSIKNILIDLNISTQKVLEIFLSNVGDRDDVSVLKCYGSGVILLSRTDHMNIDHYSNKSQYKYFGDTIVKTSIMGKMTFKEY